MSIRDNIDAIKDEEKLFVWIGIVKSENLSGASRKTKRRWKEALTKKAKEFKVKHWVL